MCHFGNFKILDREYDKHNFLIHDYFLKTIDKVKVEELLLLSHQVEQWIKRIILLENIWGEEM